MSTNEPPSAAAPVTSPVPSLDVDFVRAQFPAFAAPELADWIHAENAGGSYAAGPVIDLLNRFYVTSKVQPYGLAGPARVAGEAMDRAMELVPATFNAARDEVHFGPSTSQNTYVLAQSFLAGMADGDEVIVTNQDHEANIGSWRRMAERGITVREWQVDIESGLLDIDDLAGLLNGRTRWVCVTHASNLAATKNPVRDIADMVHAAGARLVVDGVSYAPHGYVDVQELDCDVYLYSSYKTYGPHLGLMYTRSSVLDELANQGHFFNAEYPTARLTPAGPNHAEVAAAAGMVDYYEAVHAHHFGASSSDPLALRVKQVFSLFEPHETALMAPILEVLATKDVQLVGSPVADTAVRAPTIAFRHRRMTSEDIAASLADQRIGVGFSNFYARRLVEALGFPVDDGVVRISLVHYNTLDEVDRIVTALDRVL